MLTLEPVEKIFRPTDNCCVKNILLIIFAKFKITMLKTLFSLIIILFFYRRKHAWL